MNKESSLDTVLRVMGKYSRKVNTEYSEHEVIYIDNNDFKLGIFELFDMLDEKTWELKRKIEILEEKNMLLEEIISKSNFAPLLRGDSNE